MPVAAAPTALVGGAERAAAALLWTITNLVAIAALPVVALAYGANRIYSALTDNINTRNRCPTSVELKSIAKLRRLFREHIRTEFTESILPIENRPDFTLPYFWQEDEADPTLLKYGVNAANLIKRLEYDKQRLLQNRPDSSANGGLGMARAIATKVIDCLRYERANNSGLTSYFVDDRPSAVILVLIELFDFAVKTLPKLLENQSLDGCSPLVEKILQERHDFYRACLRQYSEYSIIIIPDRPGQQSLNKTPGATIEFTMQRLTNWISNAKVGEQYRRFQSEVDKLAKELAATAEEAITLHGYLLSTEQDPKTFTWKDFLAPDDDIKRYYQGRLIFERLRALYCVLGLNNLQANGHPPLRLEKLTALEQAWRELNQGYLTRPTRRSLSVDKTGLDERFLSLDRSVIDQFLREQELEVGSCYLDANVELKPELALLDSQLNHLRDAVHVLVLARAFFDLKATSLWRGERWSIGSSIGRHIITEMCRSARTCLDALRRSTEQLADRGFMQLAGPFARINRRDPLSFRLSRMEDAVTQINQRLKVAEQQTSQVDSQSSCYDQRRAEMEDVERRLYDFIVGFNQLCGLPTIPLLTNGDETVADRPADAESRPQTDLRDGENQAWQYIRRINTNRREGRGQESNYWFSFSKKASTDKQQKLEEIHREDCNKPRDKKRFTHEWMRVLPEDDDYVKAAKKHTSAGSWVLQALSDHLGVCQTQAYRELLKGRSFFARLEALDHDLERHENANPAAAQTADAGGPTM